MISIWEMPIGNSISNMFPIWEWYSKHHSHFLTKIVKQKSENLLKNSEIF